MLRIRGVFAIMNHHGQLSLISILVLLLGSVAFVSVVAFNVTSTIRAWII